MPRLRSENRWMALFLAFMASFSFFFSLQSIPPMIPDIMRELKIGYGETGLLMSLVSLTAAVLSLLGWPMMTRWGLRRTTISFLAVCAAGTVLTFSSNSYLQLLLGRAVLGVGGGLVTVSSFAMIPLWFRDRDTARAMGFKAIDMPAAAVLSLNALPLAAAVYGWRGSVLVSTALLVVTIALFAIFFRDRPFSVGSGIFQGFINRQVWLLGIVWAFFNMAVISYVTWAGTFYIELKGIAPSVAFFLASMMMIAAIPLSPVAGRLLSRFGKKRFILLSSGGIAVSVGAIPFLTPPWLFVAVAVLAVSMPFLPPAVFSLPSEILSSEKAGLAFAVLFTCAYLGFIVGPFLVGTVQDAYPSGVESFLLMAGFSGAALGAGVILKTR